MTNKLDDTSYVGFCGPQNLHKALNTLRGIVTGAALDDVINEKERVELRGWCAEYGRYRRMNPFNEIIPLLEMLLDEQEADGEGLAELQWYLQRAAERNPFYDALTEELQVLQGILHGILADGVVSQVELTGLFEWLEENRILAGCYPYDEIYAVVINVLRDGRLDEDEAAFVKEFFTEFARLWGQGDGTGLSKDEKKKVTVLGVCAVEPQVFFEGKKFCFTGASKRTKRSEFADLVVSLGGVFSARVVKDLDYLVYGNAGNQCWAYSCYGRKVEQAVALRKGGRPAVIVHENDFWDCYEDQKSR